mmetsp:Transcript_20595/g.41868  ORF Transcript_20595/g.41868 Transcript_20595/m.41868 type:complete len:330 (-) Transcript_20595:579-1568(-)
MAAASTSVLLGELRRAKLLGCAPNARVRMLASLSPPPPPPVPFFFNDLYEVHLPQVGVGSSFPMRKYRLVREALQRELHRVGTATFHESPLVSLTDLHTVHAPHYVSRYLNNELSALENRRIGFPWSEASVQRSLSSTGGTVAAMHAVCQVEGPRFSGHIAGGTHHAFSDRGEGYCVFNDIAVASMVALRDYPQRVRRILICDLDVHQGNGCAVIFGGEARVTTYSLHCLGNLYSQRESSDVDIELPVDAGDGAYLEAMRESLVPLWERLQPHLVFFQAGVDPHESDRFGKLKLSSAGLKQRNRIVYDLAAQVTSREIGEARGGSWEGR